MNIFNKCECAFCNSANLHLIIDLGNVALAGSFIKKEQISEELKYPLKLYFCNDCFAVQIIDKVDQNTLFKDYFYFSSSIATLRVHFQNYAKHIYETFLGDKNSTVLEIGSNDGVLLYPLADYGVSRLIGVDPATNIVNTINDPRITKINKFFGIDLADEILSDYGKVNVVVANNVFAHIPDIQGATQAVYNILADDGVFIFEVHYLGNVLDEMQYDMIYHEHLYYYSLLSATNHFMRFDMVIFDVLPVETHAGSMRFYVAKKGSKHGKVISQNVTNLKQKELYKKYNHQGTFIHFATRVEAKKNKLVELLNSLRAQDKTIAGYGASGRANTIIQYCGIDHQHLLYMIDDAPAKEGFLTPGSHFNIYSKDILRLSPIPDYILVFAWSFLNEIKLKNSDYLINGGKMIIPLPEVIVI